MKRPFRKKRLDRFLSKATRGPDVDASTLLALSQEDQDELLAEAARRFDLGEIDPAEALYMLHLRLFGFSADAWLGVGACKQAKGKLPRAVEAYSNALRERPGDPFALANLAECALFMGEPIRAVDRLEGIPPQARPGLPAGLAARVERLVSLANEAIRERAGSAGPATGLVEYAIEPRLGPPEFIDLLRRSTLAERRPVDEEGAIAGMLANADVTVTARVDGLLVGVSRALTDFHFCTYLSDLAVDRHFQGMGIGRELIRRTHEAAGLKTTLILLAAPLARSYYPHVGMTAHDSCWIIPRTPALPGTPP